MDGFLGGATQALRTVIFNPESFPELALSALVGFLLFIVVYGKIGEWLGVGRTGSAASLLTFVIAAALYASIAAALAMFVKATIPIWLIGLGVSLIVIVPVICFLQKTSYITAAINWAAGVAALLIGAFLVNVVFDAVGFSKRVVDKDQERQEQRKELE